MGPVALISGLLCVAVFVLNSTMRPRSDAALIALALLGSWGAYTFLAALNPWPENVRLFAIVDLNVGITAWLCNRSQPALWKRALYWSLFAQIVWHAEFWSGWYWGDPSRRAGMMYLYAFGLNVLGFSQIALGAWPGGWDAANRLRGVLRRRASRSHPVGA